LIVSRIAVTLLAALLAAAPCIDAPSARALAPRENATNTTGLDYAPGILVVGLKEQERRDGGIDLLFGGGPGGVSSRPRLARDLPNISAQIVQVDAGSEDAWLAYLRSDPRVAYAERDHRVSVAALPPGTVSHHDRGDAAGAKIPDDPFLPLQWGLAMLRMPEAWERTTGVPDVVIALVDTGLTLGHPDLVGKLWRNEGEIAGNGLDDDGNGQVDDIHGWRYYHAYSGGAYHPGEDPYIADEHGHGTHVAGIAAAATNNGIGIAGVSWGAKIMVVRALDRYGSGWYSDVAAAVIYATDNGARIINLSLGDSEPSALLCEAIHYAHSRGCLVVAAAGNSGGAVFCPATCPQALAVAASDSADRRA